MNLYFELFKRNRGLLSEEEQTKLKNTTVAVFGLGGLGGVICEILARSGITGFKIVDKDIFDISNINRQIYANESTIGRKKTEVTKERLLQINKDITIEPFEKVDEGNIDEILTRVDVAILALDDTITCILINRKTQKQKIPLVEGWALPFGNVRVFNQNTPLLEEVYNLPTKNIIDFSGISEQEKISLNHQMLFELRKIKDIEAYYTAEAEDCIMKGAIPSFAPMVWLTSCIMSFEVIKVVLEKEDICYAPSLKLFNPFNFTCREQ